MPYLMDWTIAPGIVMPRTCDWEQVTIYRRAQSAVLTYAAQDGNGDAIAHQQIPLPWEAVAPLIALHERDTMAGVCAMGSEFFEAQGLPDFSRAERVEYPAPAEAAIEQQEAQAL